MKIEARVFSLWHDVHPCDAYVLGRCAGCNAPSAAYLSPAQLGRDEPFVQLPVCPACIDGLAQAEAEGTSRAYVRRLREECARREGEWLALYVGHFNGR